MLGSKYKIIELLFDMDNYNLSLTINLLSIALFVVVVFVVWMLIKFFNSKKSVNTDIVPVKIKYKIGGGEVEYKIERNYQNIEIAHKIYIELITRKAAIDIEEGKDVIIEVYNSWYSLFQITRNELKSFKGKLLKENNTSKDLVRLLTDILNIGLRPHLTEYQAKFRKDYSERLEASDSKSPQQIQEGCEDYDELIKSMKNVNRILIDYSLQLKKIIDGK